METSESDVAVKMAAILGTMIALLAGLATMQTPKVQKADDIQSTFLPSATQQPTKYAYEMFALVYTPVWIALFGAVVVLQLYEDFTATSYNVFCGGSGTALDIAADTAAVSRIQFSRSKSTAGSAICYENQCVARCLCVHRELLVHTLFLFSPQGRVHHAGDSTQQCSNRHVLRNTLLLFYVPRLFQCSASKGGHDVCARHATNHAVCGDCACVCLLYRFYGNTYDIFISILFI